MQDFGLYVIITDPVLSYRRIAEICVERGVRMLQLRQKQITDREILAAADEILSVTRGTRTSFVMNDRIDLALIAGADVLHLGQNDISISDARALIGDRPLRIGLSTHSIEQAREALVQKPDYIGFGPIYATPTKAIPDPVVGAQRLREILEFADVPVVAIGGIDEKNLDEVLDAGAQNVCMVRYLMQSPELDSRIRAVQQRIS